MSYSIFGPIYQYALNNFRGAASLVPIVQHACKLTGGLIQKWTEIGLRGDRIGVAQVTGHYPYHYTRPSAC